MLDLADRVDEEMYEEEGDIDGVEAEMGEEGETKEEEGEMEEEEEGTNIIEAEVDTERETWTIKAA